MTVTASKTYANDPSDTNTLIATPLETVYADSKGIMSIASSVAGLIINPATGKFTHFTHNPDNPQSFIS